MRLGFIWSSAVKDLRRRRRDPVAFLLWVSLPLIVGLLLSLAFGGDGGGLRAHLLVVDKDGSFLSNLIAGAYSQGPLADLVEAERVEEAEGRSRMEAGDASALLIIPEGFGSAVLNERPVALTLITNPAQRILPGIIEESLSMMVDGAFYLQRLLGEPVRELAEGPPPGRPTYPDSTIVAFSVTVNRLVERLDPYLFPPAIELETTVIDEEAGPAPNFATLFFPGLLIMALLFVAQGLSQDVWKERAQGTLRRIVTTPRTMAGFLAGKLLAGGLLVAGVCLVGLLAGRWAFGVPVADLPLAVLWAALVGTALLALLTLVQLYATSERGGNVLTTVVVFLLIFLGGSFFPFEVMPEGLARIGQFTPNGWALEELKDILFGKIEPGSLAAGFGGFSAVGAAAFLLSVRRLRRGFLQG